MFRSILIATSLIIVFIFSGCKKLITLDVPKTQYLSQVVYATDDNAKGAVTGMYASLVGNDLMGLASTYNFMLSGETVYPHNTYRTNDMSYTDVMAQNVWKYAYTTIFQANSIIEGCSASTGMTDSTKKQFSGEAKFVRAFLYFYLYHLYGPVPLVTTTSLTNNISGPRNDSATIYKQMIADLEDAEAGMISGYSLSNNERTRANKHAAAALLARIYLYAGNYAKAEAQASIVIDNNNGIYSLLPGSKIADVFLKNSGETILALNTTAYGHTYTTDGVAGYFGRGQLPDYYNLTQSTFSAFEPNDIRSTVWVNNYQSGGTTYYYPNKYRSSYDNFNTYQEYYMLLRLAEQYLIRAEARILQGNISGATADLNVIRTRAGLPGTQAASAAELLEAVHHEIQVEYFCEDCYRWIDCKRSGRINAVMSVVKPATWKPYQALYPIPLSEIQANPALTQNPGYNF